MPKTLPTVTRRETIAISRALNHPKFAARLIIASCLFGVIVAFMGIYISTVICVFVGLGGMPSVWFRLITAPIFTLILAVKYHEPAMVWVIRKRKAKLKQRARGTQKNLNFSLPDRLDGD